MTAAKQQISIGAGTIGFPARSLSAVREVLNGEDGLSNGWQILLFLLVLVALISRRPDLFLRPQFYAEDGAVWYAEAYNLGWLHSLGMPEGGYLNTVQRLAAGLALLVPLKFAPLLMNTCGLIIQALPVPALLSARCRTWGSLAMRVGMAAIYVALPNAPEIHVVLTNAQWHLALLLVILAFAEPPNSMAGRLADAAVFAVGSVSGPFGLFLLPLGSIFAWVRKQHWTLALIALLSAGGAIQVHELMVSPRHHAVELGASGGALLRLLGGHIFLSGVLGSNFRVPGLPFAVLGVTLLFGMAICFACFLKGPLPMKLTLVFAALVLAAALRNPLIDDRVSLWHALLGDPGARYWFFPVLSFLWAALWCAVSSGLRAWRYCGAVVLLLLPIGIVRNWAYAPFQDHHFQMYVEQFDRAKSGEQIVIPVYPGATTMKLTKR